MQRQAFHQRTFAHTRSALNNCNRLLFAESLPEVSNANLVALLKDILPIILSINEDGFLFCRKVPNSSPLAVFFQFFLNKRIIGSWPVRPELQGNKDLVQVNGFRD